MLPERETQLTELMDSPDCDPVRLRRTLQRFALVNRLVSRWSAIYDTHLRPVFHGHQSDNPVRLLDIGTGGGDVLRHIVSLARRDGFETQAVGIDPDPRAISFASRTQVAMPGVTYRLATSRELMKTGERFDIVISNHLLHHLTDLNAVIADSTALATHLCVHSDIARSRLAYLAFALGVTSVSPGSFLRTDGLRSIRRSYTPAELLAQLPDGWCVDRVGTFRLLAVCELSG